jgi:hypothetical protein
MEATMAKQPKVDVGLLVSSVRKDGYFHIRAHAVVLHTERHGSVRNPRDSEDYNGLCLYGLEVGSQGNERQGYSGTPNPDPKLYGFDVLYRDVYSIDTRMAGRMAKTLKRVDAKLAKLYDERGYTTSFGEYVTRVATAIGAKTLVFAKGPEWPGWSYTEREFDFATVGDGRYRIERMEADWRKAILPEPVAEVAD